MLSLFVGRVLCILANRSMEVGVGALLDAKESVEDAGLFTLLVGYSGGINSATHPNLEVNRVPKYSNYDRLQV